MDKKATGFASPAQGYEEDWIDLNRVLIHNPPATIFVRLDSDDMSDFGLPRGTLLIVDRSKTPGANNFAVLRHEGRFLCRLLTKNRGKTGFTDGNREFYPVQNETEIIGAVTAAIRVFTDAYAH